MARLQAMEAPFLHELCPLPEIDRLLACRGIRHHTLGPTGAHVFCAHLENALGMRGRFCYGQDAEGFRLSDPILLDIFVNQQPLQGTRAACMFYPSHSRRQIKEAGLGLIEYKFISWDDVICDVLELTNHAGEALPVSIQAQTAAAQELTRIGRDLLLGTSALKQEQGGRVWLLLAMPTTKTMPAERLVCELVLQPGETVSLLVALAVGLRQAETQAALKRWACADNPLAIQQQEYQNWFTAHCPRFVCPEERFIRLWYYRWFLLRHNLAAAPYGAASFPLLSSLSSFSDKAITLWLPQRPQQDAQARKENGFLYFQEARQGVHSGLRIVSAPLVLQEARWLKAADFVHGEIKMLLSGQSPAGLYQDVPSSFPDAEEPAFLYKEWLSAAIEGALRIWPDTFLATLAAESAVQHLAALRQRADPNHNFLLHGGAGPLDSYEDAQALAAREAVDFSAMFAASLQATAVLLATIGRELDARWHKGLAEHCGKALVEQLWDEWDKFFYDQEAHTKEPLRQPHIGGFAPFVFGFVPAETKYMAPLAMLVAPEHFWTPFPVAQKSLLSASQETPVALPYTNSLITEAMAHALRAYPQNYITRRRLMEFLWLFAGLQLEGGDLMRPMTREAYNAQTGEGFGAYDCLQSNFNDLIIRHLIGLTPRDDELLEVTPLCEGWDYFMLHEAPYRGHRISVIWDNRPAGRRLDGVPRGLSVYVDGKLAAEAPALERLLVPIAKEPSQ